MFKNKPWIEKAYLRRMAKIDANYGVDQAKHNEDIWWNKAHQKDRENAVLINKTIASIDRRWDMIENSTKENE